MQKVNQSKKKIIVLGSMKGKKKQTPIRKWAQTSLKLISLNCLMLLSGCTPHNPFAMEFPTWVNAANIMRGGVFGLACVLLAVLLGILAAFVMEDE